MSREELSVHIEALLFALGRPLSRAELAKMLSASKEDIDSALEALRSVGAGRGFSVVDDGSVVELRVSGSASNVIERIRKDEYSREVGRAGQETLAAILYRGPLTRAEIDFIRGVNSTQTLRTLTMRGLLRRIPNPKDERQYLYQPTTELLSQLGVSRVEELPEYSQIKEKLAALERAYREAQEEKHEEA